MGRDLYSGVSEQLKASHHRLEDAKALLKEGRWRCSMYIAGYAVECRLKAKLMKMRDCYTLEQVDELLPRNRTVFTHQLRDLLDMTRGLDRMKANAEAWGRFNMVNRWIPAWRYSSGRATRDEAETYVNAVEEMLRWIDYNL